jgi:hypothetical protein
VNKLEEHPVFILYVKYEVVMYLNHYSEQKKGRREDKGKE